MEEIIPLVNQLLIGFSQLDLGFLSVLRAFLFSGQLAVATANFVDGALIEPRILKLSSL